MSNFFFLSLKKENITENNISFNEQTKIYKPIFLNTFGCLEITRTNGLCSRTLRILEFYFEELIYICFYNFLLLNIDKILLIYIIIPFSL